MKIMKKYIGTKQIEAEPMTMGEAYERGLLQAGRVPNESEKSNAGYHVRYQDGYESWSPAAPFKEAYRRADTFLDRLFVELSDLTEKWDRLNGFLDSEMFKNLPLTSRTLLKAQHGVMSAYIQILSERIRMEECREGEDHRTEGTL